MVESRTDEVLEVLHHAFAAKNVWKLNKRKRIKLDLWLQMFMLILFLYHILLHHG